MRRRFCRCVRSAAAGSKINITHSNFLILFTVIPVVIAVSALIDISVNDTHQGNISQQINTIGQMLGVFYDDLDRNIDMFANRVKVKSSDSTLTKDLDQCFTD